ncbi:hypothetical protein AVEN_108374-1 [Araneus ventricosus]|uniref:Uncharacterized protein n=1 Tax=Araneus ventricosus TaxID=182803 RepID=A0A4Y2CXD1_ARAVE|nr:hypothetical protein AVEN_108374-1 [Araneus ventricosus]
MRSYDSLSITPFRCKIVQKRGRGGFVVRSQLRSRRAPDSKPDSTEDPRSAVFVSLVHVNPGMVTLLHSLNGRRRSQLSVSLTQRYHTRVKYDVDQSPFLLLVWCECLERVVPARVYTMSSDRGSKLRCLSQIDYQVV